MPADNSVDAPRFSRYPVISLSAEYLVMGHLMRRNILTYKAPPNNEGYDLICIHPDPRKKMRPVRVQVKSRLATDCDRAFPVKRRSFGAFDYLIIAFLNVGYFFKKQPAGGTCREGARDTEFYTFPLAFIQEHHKASSSWERVRTRGLDIASYKNESGFEHIAKRLRIKYPEKYSRGEVNFQSDS
jgi:hypothetical protein